MIWDSWGAFWEMGGSGPFVWGSYGVTTVLIVAELIMLRTRRVSSTRKLNRLMRAGHGRKLPEVQGS
ncbi:MAG: heme exporter protein CcmD [Rhodocyclaceae bacterium]|nr:heme exporter protein CcmD [Rhodocyclaceae bacterium]